MSFAPTVGERLAIIDHGKLIAVDSPEHLKATYGGAIVELETVQPSNALAELRRLPGVKDVQQEGNRFKITTEGIGHVVPHIVNLVSQENALRDIAVREPNLDEIFLRLTGAALRD